MDAIVKMLEKHQPFFEKISRNIYLQAIKDGFLGCMPIVLTSSIFLLIATLPGVVGITLPQPLIDWCNKLYNFTMGVMGIMVAGTTAKNFTASMNRRMPAGKVLNDGSTMVAAQCSMLLLAVTQFTTKFNGSELSVFDCTSMGTRGLFSAYIAAFITVWVYKFCVSRDLTIKLPKEVPGAIAQNFRDIIPFGGAVIICGIIDVVVRNLMGVPFSELLIKLLSPLFTAAETYPGLILIQAATAFFWFIGVHGPSIVQPGIDPIRLANQAENLQVLLAGGHPAHSLTFNMSLVGEFGGTGATFIVPLLLILFMKSKQLKAVGKASIVPVAFAVNEPLLFGAPMILNPYMLIPFVAAGCVNVSVAKFFIDNVGMNGFSFVVPWATPAPIGIFITTNFQLIALVFVAIIILLDAIIYLPFLKAYDKLLCDQEAERAAERGNRRGNNDRRGGRRNDRNASDNNSERNASESRPHSHRTNASNNVAAGMDFPNPDKQGKGKKRKGGHNNEEDHYSRMAREAEEYSREKVLEEARAAVEEASRESTGRRKKRKEKREREAAKAQEERKIEEALAQGVNPEELDAIKVSQGVTVQELAEALDVPANDIIKRLFLLGAPLTMTQSMSDDLVELVADDLGRQIKIITPEEENTFSFYDDPADLKPRAPVVTVMGHVDHGKTSLLDAIRHTGVAAGEAGGITQAIGASQVMINDRKITFIDTPGHATFTAMRARGAKVTDIVILIVAADDGVMPQTIESINHAKAAGVPIVVAVNKIDKPGANPDRVRQELTEYGIIPEEWGGQNMFVNISAKQKIGIDDLLETVLLQADVLELKANPDTFASGNVLEAKLDKGRGSVATVLVTRGTLHVGDTLVAGLTYGRVRAMLDPKGNAVTEAGPSDAVEILGLQSVPNAGDEFRVFEDEREARALADERSLKARIEEQSRVKHVTLENLFETIADAEVKELNLIIKADVQGSIEALQDSLDKMDQSEVRINTIHSAVGAINETDVVLADASNAIIIGFGVRPDGKARSAAEREGVEIRCYDVIYKCLEELDAARIGMLKPTEVEVSTGTATVLDTFKVPKVGIAAGVRVEEGEIAATDSVRLVRDGIVVFNGKIASMRHYKDEAKSLKSGSEGGIGLENFQDIKPGDQIEGYRIDQVARTE